MVRFTQTSLVVFCFLVSVICAANAVEESSSEWSCSGNRARMEALTLMQKNSVMHRNVSIRVGSPVIVWEKTPGSKNIVWGPYHGPKTFARSHKSHKTTTEAPVPANAPPLQPAAAPEAPIPDLPDIAIGSSNTPFPELPEAPPEVPANAPPKPFPDIEIGSSDSQVPANAPPQPFPDIEIGSSDSQVPANAPTQPFPDIEIGSSEKVEPNEEEKDEDDDDGCPSTLGDRNERLCKIKERGIKRIERRTKAKKERKQKRKEKENDDGATNV